MIPGPKAPDGAPNVLLVLIDDAGFGAPDTFGGPVSTPNYTRVQEMGIDLQPLPRDGGLLADARRAADRPQPAPGRLRVDRRVPRPVPGLHGRQAEELRGAAADPLGERLRHGRVRQVAPDAEQRPGRGRAVRPLAEVVGLRPLVGVPVGRRGPVRPDHDDGRHRARRAGGQGRRDEYYFPDDLTDKAVEWLHRVRAQDAGEALVHVLLDRLRPRPAPRRHRVGGQVQGPVRRRLGRAARADPRASEAARDRAAGHRADGAPGRTARPGTTSTTPRRRCTRGRWRSTAATRRTPTGTSGACWTRSRSSATWTTR